MPTDIRTDLPIAPPSSPEQDWFREPSPREHRIAAFLFIGFGVFFALLFVLLAGWWFRWVILSLALVSVLYAGSHVKKRNTDRTR